ncbi:XRE family transcriptional regulator [Extibacter muris]|uniref:XRE family transcriptional regulator n=2 Tax=Extibacter muris TaxID=1796622 RepID=A0A4R4FEJ0_9FIRM|nr:XRE family transcriptional regulator [Extibacter muris]TDA21798.1 XRE family transcriptional regulator [Extibacter muris]
MNNLEFALEMKNKRLASGLSQGELAGLTHVSRYSINRFENGKANASRETQNIILRSLNYCICEKPFTLWIDYLAVRFPTTDGLAIIRKLLGIKARYFIHYDYGYYGYKEHYAYGEIKVMVSDDEHMGVFVELKGTGSRNMEYVLQAQHRDWYMFLNHCLDLGGIIKRIDLAVNDMCGLLDIPVLSEKYHRGNTECRSKSFESVHSGRLGGKNRQSANTLYIGSKSSTKYFCLYEKDKEQQAKGKKTDIKNRFEIRLRSTKAVQAVEELLLTQNPRELVFYLITDFVDFPDYSLWEIFISHDSLPLEMNPVPVNLERTLSWLERQVMPSLVMLEEIDRLTGTSYMKEIDENSKLSEKQEMTVLQMCMDISEVIESEGVFYE